MAKVNKYIKNSLFNAGLYMRLSKEDGDKQTSESILSQSMQLNEFVNSQTDIIFTKNYIDDGFSGTNFSRPAFISMINDIKQGKINCVIVKDLSRFGRNYIESGQYLEGFFPIFNVRFISIIDQIDSFLDPESINGISTVFKNVINDEYCRDISLKIKSVLNVKRENGEFVGAFAPFGYIKDQNNKNKLIIDQSVAFIVEKIFRLYLSGMSIRSITRHLNNLSIISPSEHKKATEKNFFSPKLKINDGLWSDISVRQILTNPIYTGDLYQSKTQTISHKLKVRYKIERQNQIVVQNTHQPIISKQMFSDVERLLSLRTRISSGGQVSLFAGIVKCGDCGRKMIKKGTNLSYFYYICRTYEKKSGSCTRHAIRSDKLERAVFTTIFKYIEIAVEVQKVIDLVKYKPNPIKNLEQFNEKIYSLEQSILDLYPDYKSNLLSKEQYIKLKNKYESELNSVKNQINSVKNEQNLIENEFIKSLVEIKNITKLTREIVCGLIDDILVFEGGKITINFKFQNAYLTAKNYIERVGKENLLEEKWENLQNSGVAESI